MKWKLNKGTITDNTHYRVFFKSEDFLHTIFVNKIFNTIYYKIQ